MLIDIETLPNSLVQPFNPEKVEELTVTALAVGGFTIPPILPVSVSSSNTLLNVTVEQGVYNETEIAQILVILNAVCQDPTRNELTEDQQEEADLAAKLALAKADIITINATGTGLKDQVTTAGGLKDRITVVPGGLKDRLLTLVEFNALSAADRDRLVRAVLLDTLTLLNDSLALINDALTVQLHGARADKFELRHIQQEIDE